MLAVGRTTNALFADLVTKGTLFEAVSSIPRSPTQEKDEKMSVTDLRAFAILSSRFYMCACMQGVALCS